MSSLLIEILSFSGGRRTENSNFYETLHTRFEVGRAGRRSDRASHSSSHDNPRVSCKHSQARQTDCLISLLLWVESSNQSAWLACVYTIPLDCRGSRCTELESLRSIHFFPTIWQYFLPFWLSWFHECNPNLMNMPTFMQQAFGTPVPFV